MVVVFAGRALEGFCKHDLRDSFVWDEAGQLQWPGSFNPFSWEAHRRGCVTNGCTNVAAPSLQANFESPK